jgi:outer membrane protein OmpA-like peptidoglycan-associated protein
LAAPVGFDVNRLDPSERGSDWFANESLDLRGHVRPAVGLLGDYGYKPLVVYNADGSERAAIVKHQLYAHLGAGLILFDRLRLDANLPIALFQDGEATTLSGTALASTNKTTIGDLRLGGDVRLVGQYGEVFTLAAGLQARLPTGSRSAFTGDGSGEFRFGPRIMAAGDAGLFTYAARISMVYRSSGEELPGGLAKVGSEFQFGVAAGVRLLDKHLTAGPELYGATVTQGGAFKKSTTPLELLFGGHYRFDNGLRLGAGAGPGLTRGVGEPVVRVLALVEWMPDVAKPPPPPPPPVEAPRDRDRDGIADNVDACPDVPGVPSKDPKLNGCPPPDRDKDGILDPVDACPDLPGTPSDDSTKNGCPDRDKDGIFDPSDACPDEAGPASSDPSQNGCPDRDKDGIIDKLDACPDQPGPKDPDPKKNGCPAARIEAGQIKIIEQVKFAFGSAKILPESDPILTAVNEILTKHPEITQVDVEGHTDNKGAFALNLKLSKDRAAAVAAWLVKHGVDKKRLVSHGYGPNKPIDTNDTDAGRANNRRVEFHITGGTPTGVAPSP